MYGHILYIIVHVYEYLCVFMYIYTYLYIFMHDKFFTRKVMEYHIYLYIYIYTHTYTALRTHARARARARVCVLYTLKNLELKDIIRTKIYSMYEAHTVNLRFS